MNQFDINHGALIGRSDAVRIGELDAADAIVIAFSGGKDSLAMVLHLIELGYRDKLTLMHSCIDADEVLFDWPVTEAYVHAVAKHLRLPLVMNGRGQWRLLVAALRFTR